MITWHFITSAAYLAASDDQKTSDKLFFLSDTGEIYRGKQSFTESVILHTDEPTVKAVGKLYVNSSTLEGRVWNGSSWTTIVQPVQAAIAASDATLPVSGKAVADYVSKRIEDVTGSGNLVASVSYVEGTNSLTVAMADGSSDTIPMSNVAADLVYDAATGKLQVKNAAGTAIGTGINLDLERFVSAASYDHETRTITLSFNAGDPLTIDIGDLVDTYTAANSTSVAMTVTGNQFAAEVIVASTDGNLLQKTENGLYVAPVDLSGKMDKDTDAVEGNLAKFDDAGNAIDAGVVVGGAALNAEPNATTLATESAVAAIRTALQNAINGKMNMVETSKADELLIATADGHAKVSGVKIGGENIAAEPNAATLATEAAMKNYVTSYSVAKTDVVTSDAFAAQTSASVSDAKIASEKAVFDAMTWKTVV